MYHRRSSEEDPNFRQIEFRKHPEFDLDTLDDTFFPSRCILVVSLYFNIYSKLLPQRIRRPPKIIRFGYLTIFTVIGAMTVASTIPIYYCVQNNKH